MFSHLTPRILARAPFRVAVSAATTVAILGAGGFMASPRSGASDVAAPDAILAPAVALTLAASAVPIAETSPDPATPGPAFVRGPIDVVAAKPADLTCLAKAVYYEARGESADGQAAVAQVVINRTHRANYPANVCEVVFQGVQGGCQFSFVCNGAMNRPLEMAAWSRARRVAADVLGGHVMRAVGPAISFHAASLGPERSGEIARIGGHVFFMPGKALSAPGGRPSHALRFAGQTDDAPTPATSATVAGPVRDTLSES